MTIQSKEAAFKAIEELRFQIPFEAIEFLYNHPEDQEIIDKIIFALENAYKNEFYYDELNDYYSSAPLWYAVVAENHLNESLIETYYFNDTVRCGRLGFFE